VGFILEKEHYQVRPSASSYEILDFKHFEGYSAFFPKQFYPKNNDLIKLTRSNQGHITLTPKWSIVWRIKNHNGFKLTDRPIIFNMGTASIITSDNEDEMHYLLSILNSTVSKLILESFLKIPTEKEYLVAVLPVKRYIRVPKLNASNEKIKKEVITQTKSLLNNERYSIQDFVDFKSILQQKFDSIEVQSSSVIINYKDNCVKCKIKGNASIIEANLADQLHSLFDDNGIGSISDLKNLHIIDKELQVQIKNYIDDLVYALYFNVKLQDIGFVNRDKVHIACAKHEYYNQINE